jgi:hypothetical protein
MLTFVPSAAAMPEVTVQGVVWSDANCDGIRQNSEAPYANQTVWLFAAGADSQINTSDDQVIQTWTTGDAGMYRFDRGITDLDYALLILPIARPAGMIPSSLNAGSDRTVDNDMRADLWATNGFRMNASQTVTGIDIGLCRNPNTVFVPVVIR